MVSYNTFLAIMVVAAALSTADGAELKGAEVVHHHASHHDVTASSAARFFHAVRVSFSPSRITVPVVPNVLVAQPLARDGE